MSKARATRFVLEAMRRKRCKSPQESGVLRRYGWLSTEVHFVTLNLGWFRKIVKCSCEATIRLNEVNF